MTDYENKQHIALENLLKEEGYSSSQKEEAHLIITLSNQFIKMFPEYQCGIKPLPDNLKMNSGATLIINIVKKDRKQGKIPRKKKNKQKQKLSECVINNGKLMYSYLCFTNSQKENYGGIMPLNDISQIEYIKRQ